MGVTLEVKPRHKLWFLHPEDPRLGPTRDTVVDGDIILSLPSRRKIKTIDVQLVWSWLRRVLSWRSCLSLLNQVGVQSMLINRNNVSYTTMSTTTSIKLSEELDAGTHRFQFQLIANANTPPSERLGKFQYDIPIETQLPHGGKVKANTTHKVIARVAGLGFLGSNLVQEAEICLQATSNKEGYAASYHQAETFFHPVLGTVQVALISKYLILYGFLACQIEIPEMEHAVTIAEIKVVLVQYVTLTNMQDTTQQETITPFEIVLWQLDSKTPGDSVLPWSLVRGERFQHCENRIRLPSDNTTRQTTSEFSDTGIRISHKLKVLIRYTEAGENEDLKELSIGFPAPISSCDHSLGNLLLPDYANSDDSSARYKKAGLPDCLCQLHEWIGEDEVERIYGVGDLKVDNIYSPSSQGTKPKWEAR